MKILSQRVKNQVQNKFLYQYAEGLNAGDRIDSQKLKYEELYSQVQVESQQDLQKLSEALVKDKAVEITKEGGYLYGALWKILYNEDYDSSKSFNTVKNSGNPALLKKQASVMLALKELTAQRTDVNTFRAGESVMVLADGTISITRNTVEVDNGVVENGKNLDKNDINEVKGFNIPTEIEAGKPYKASVPNDVQSVIWKVGTETLGNNSALETSFDTAGAYEIVVSGVLANGTPFEKTVTVKVTEATMKLSNQVKNTISSRKSEYDGLIKGQKLPNTLEKKYTPQQQIQMKEFFLAVPSSQEANLRGLLEKNVSFSAIEKRINLYSQLSDPNTIEKLQVFFTTFGAEGRTEDQVKYLAQNILRPDFNINQTVKCELEGWDEGGSANYNKTGSERISRKEFIARVLNDASTIAGAFEVQNKVEIPEDDKPKIARIREFTNALESWHKLEFDQNNKSDFLCIYSALDSGNLTEALTVLQRIMTESDFHEQADWAWQKGYAERVNAYDIAKSSLALGKAYRALGNPEKSGEFILENIEQEIGNDETKKQAAAEIFNNFEANISNPAVQAEAVQMYQDMLNGLAEMSQNGVYNLQYLQLLENPEATIQQLIILKSRAQAFDSFFENHSQDEISNLFGENAEYYMDMMGSGTDWFNLSDSTLAQTQSGVIMAASMLIPPNPAGLLSGVARLGIMAGRVTKAASFVAKVQKVGTNAARALVNSNKVTRFGLNAVTKGKNAFNATKLGKSIRFVNQFDKVAHVGNFARLSSMRKMNPKLLNKLATHVFGRLGSTLAPAAKFTVMESVLSKYIKGDSMSLDRVINKFEINYTMFLAFGVANAAVTPSILKLTQTCRPFAKNMAEFTGKVSADMLSFLGMLELESLVKHQKLTPVEQDQIIETLVMAGVFNSGKISQALWPNLANKAKTVQPKQSQTKTKPKTEPETKTETKETQKAKKKTKKSVTPETSKTNIDTKTTTQRANEVAEDLCTLHSGSGNKVQIPKSDWNYDKINKTYNNHKADALTRLLSNRVEAGKLAPEKARKIFDKAKNGEIINIKNIVATLSKKEQKALVDRNVATTGTTTGKNVLKELYGIKPKKPKKKVLKPSQNNSITDGIDIKPRKILGIGVWRPLRLRFQKLAFSLERFLSKSPDLDNLKISRRRFWVPSLEKLAHKALKYINRLERYKIKDADIPQGLSKKARTAKLKEQALVNESIQKVQDALLARVKKVEKVLKSLQKTGDKKAGRTLNKIKVKKSGLNLETAKNTKTPKKKRLEVGKDYSKNGIARKKLAVGDKIKISKKHEIEVVQKTDSETLVNVIETGQNGQKKIVKKSVALNEKLKVGNELTVGKDILPIKNLEIQKLGKQKKSKEKKKPEENSNKPTEIETPEASKPLTEDPLAQKQLAQKQYAEISDADWIAANREIQQIKKNKRHQKEFEEILVSQKKEMDDLRAKYNKDIAESNQKLTEAQKDLDVKKTEIETLKKQTVQDKDAIRKAELERNAMTEKVDKIKQKNKKLKTELETAQQNLNTLQAEYNKISTDFAVAKRELELKNESHKTALEAQQKVNEALLAATKNGNDGQLAQLKNSLDEKNAEVVRLKSEKESWQQKYDLLEKRMNEKTQEISNLVPSVKIKNINVISESAGASIASNHKSPAAKNTAKTKPVEPVKTQTNPTKSTTKTKTTPEAKSTKEFTNILGAEWKGELSKLAVGKKLVANNYGVKFEITKTSKGYAMKRNGKPVRIEGKIAEFSSVGVLSAKGFQHVKTLDGSGYIIKGKESFMVQKKAVKQSASVKEEVVQHQVEVTKTDIDGKTGNVSQTTVKETVSGKKKALNEGDLDISTIEGKKLGEMSLNKKIEKIQNDFEQFDVNYDQNIKHEISKFDESTNKLRRFSEDFDTLLRVGPSTVDASQMKRLRTEALEEYSLAIKNLFELRENSIQNRSKYLEKISDLKSGNAKDLALNIKNKLDDTSSLEYLHKSVNEFREMLEYNIENLTPLDVSTQLETIVSMRNEFIMNENSYRALRREFLELGVQ